MSNYLKLIGSSSKPITDPPFNGLYDEKYIGFRKARKPGIRCGDTLFLYAPGGSKRIFAFAEATGEPEPNADYNSMEEGSCRWEIPVKYKVNLPVALGILIDEIGPGQRNLIISLRRQSHIKLTDEESKSIVSKLLEKISKVNSQQGL